MEKIGFSKFNAKVNTQVNKVSFNGIDIEVKEYLPIEEKMSLIETIVNEALSRNLDFYNPGEIEAMEVLCIVKNYTNISFTEKQEADIPKLYDIIVSSGLGKIIISAISDEEINTLESLLYNSLDNIYKRRTSLLGMLETIQQDYSALDTDATAIQNKLASEKESIFALRDIMTNLG